MENANDAIELLEDSVLPEGVVDVVIDGKERFGRDGVEHCPYPIVAGNAHDAEEALGIVPAPAAFQGLLMSEEGRRLGKNTEKAFMPKSSMPAAGRQSQKPTRLELEQQGAAGHILEASRLIAPAPLPAQLAREPGPMPRGMRLASTILDFACGQAACQRSGAGWDVFRR